MSSFADWINRKRHNRGYGVQSPSAFFFVTQVLREKLPYYAYEELDNITTECGEMKKRASRRLFRIANYTAPTNAIIVGSIIAACAISNARRKIPKLLLTESTTMPTEAAGNLEACNCIHKAGDTLQLLKESLGKGNTIGMLYIGQCSQQKEMLEAALEHTGKESIIIVEGIHRSKEWWQHVIANPKAIVTYDMFSMGILFFDKEKQKQNYTLKL